MLSNQKSYSLITAPRHRRWLVAAILSKTGEIPKDIGGYRTLNSPANGGQASRYKLNYFRHVLLSVVDPP